MENQESYVYRDVVGKPGYRVSDDGLVQTAWTAKGVSRGQRRIGDIWVTLSPNRLKRGHLQVKVGRTNRLVHHLVLEAFVGPCPPGLECRHLNGIPHDNRLENLVWGTPSENQIDSAKHGTLYAADLDQKDVLEIFLSKEKPSDIAPKFGVSARAVMDIRRGRTWSWLTGATRSSERANWTYLEANGERLPTGEWMRRLGCSRSTIFARLKKGWSVERAVTTPV